MTTPAHRYHASLIGMHWLTLALLAAVYALIELRGIFPKRPNYFSVQPERRRVR